MGTPYMTEPLTLYMKGVQNSKDYITIVLEGLSDLPSEFNKIFNVLD